MQPRFIKLHPRTKNKLIRMKLESSSDGAYRVSTRIHSVLLNNDGRTSGEIATILNVSREKVSKWLKIFEYQGVEGLMEGFHSGRPPRLSDIQKTLICDIVDSGPIAYGLMTGVWTSTNISEIINYEFNVKYHPGHVRKLLQEFGFSIQSPTRLLAAADKDKKEKWVVKSYPKLKKKLDLKVLE